MLSLKQELDNNFHVLSKNQQQSVKVLTKIMTLFDKISKTQNPLSAEYAKDFEQYGQNILKLKELLEASLYLISKHQKDLLIYEAVEGQEEADKEMEIEQLKELMRIGQLNRHILQQMKEGNTKYLEMRTLIKYCGRVNNEAFFNTK